MVLPAPPEIEEARKKWLMSKRQTLIMELGAIEDYLGMDRSIVPKHKKGEFVDALIFGMMRLGILPIALSSEQSDRLHDFIIARLNGEKYSFVKDEK